MKSLPPVTAQAFSEVESQALIGEILDGDVPDTAIQGFLLDLASRGETASEIAGAARALRVRMIAVTAPKNAIDVCGTGGDGFHTLNVSTAVSFVVAACGVPVAKHGNRAASSKAGAADTLEALGINLARAGQMAEATLADLNIAFLFAPDHHPALVRIAPIRKSIGQRTIFNLMGPLANPAQVSHQLVGIARPAYVPIYADALVRLGTGRSLVVAGDEGLDELSLAGGNEVADVCGHDIAMHRISPSDAGLAQAPVSSLCGGDAHHNAACLQHLLDDASDQNMAYRDAVLFNAAGALIVAGMTESWLAGASIAHEALVSGAAKDLFNRWFAALN